MSRPSIGDIWPQDRMTPEQKQAHEFRKKTRWPEAGACNGHAYPSLWSTDHDDGRPSTEFKEQIATAKKICHEECPVVVECLEYALELAMPWGIWGGLSPEERKEARQRRMKKRWRERQAGAYVGRERQRDDKGRWVSSPGNMD